MQDDDRQQRLADDTTPRPETTDAQPDAAPVVRLLANPRRVRRA